MIELAAVCLHYRITPAEVRTWSLPFWWAIRDAIVGPIEEVPHG